LINLVFNSTLPTFTAVPQNFSFYANVTYGSIDNTNTKAWVTLTDITAATNVATWSLNGTINTKNVNVLNNNGVPYENYTWFTALNEKNLGCTAPSCAKNFSAVPDQYTITVYMTENGASMGGDFQSMSVTYGNTPATALFMVSTFVNSGFISPVESYNGIPVVVQFYTNISWGYTSAADTTVSLQVSNATAPYAAPTAWNFTFTTNKTTTQGFTSVLGFNGTVNGVPYTYATWTLTLNKTTLVCSTASCSPTLAASVDGMQGVPVNLTIWVNELGASAGGLAAATGSMIPEDGTVGYGILPTEIGSTMINAAVTSEVYDAWGNLLSPLPFTDLPYVAAGTVNISWVNPNVLAGVGNSTFEGYVQVWDVSTLTLLTTFSLNGSAVNYNTASWANAAGVSLSLIGNGTTLLGTPYQNWGWTITLTATAASMGATVPYGDQINLTVYITAVGTGFGGVVQNTGAFPLFTFATAAGPVPFYPSFVQYPTTVSAAFTSACPATGKCSPTFSAYMTYPFTANYTLSIANAPINAGSTFVYQNVTDTSTGALLSSTEIFPANNQNLYVFPVSAATLACSSPTCVSLPQDEFEINVAVVVNGISYPTNGSVAGTNITEKFFLITTPLSAALVSPASGTSASVGNVTVSLAYLGSWVAGSVLNIYSSTNALVYSHGFVELTPGVPVNGTWFIGQPGTYTYAIVMTTVYLPTTHYFNGTISVISKGGTVYQNSTKYSNESAISGLSGAAAGTILLVVGLIVGMIVALVLARAVMGRPAAAPPQPWESKPGTPGGGAPNTCSVCSKSFSTPEELAAHGKSEHGMQ
jgi:hypothetical protein